MSTVSSNPPVDMEAPRYVNSKNKYTKLVCFVYLISFRKYIFSQLDDWVLCRIYKKQSSAQKQVYSNPMTSGREYSNNDSSTSSSSHQYNDVLESLHEIDNRSLGFAAGSSNAPPHHSHRPSLNEQKTGFLNLAREPSFDWPSYGGHNSVPELTPSHNVPRLRYGDGGGYFQSVKTNEEDNKTQQQAEGFSADPVNGFGYSDQQHDAFGFI